jgi:hypothetical protein
MRLYSTVKLQCIWWMDFTLHFSVRQRRRRRVQHQVNSYRARHSLVSATCNCLVLLQFFGNRIIFIPYLRHFVWYQNLRAELRRHKFARSESKPSLYSDWGQFKPSWLDSCFSNAEQLRVRFSESDCSVSELWICSDFDYLDCDFDKQPLLDSHFFWSHDITGQVLDRYVLRRAQTRLL